MVSHVEHCRYHHFHSCECECLRDSVLQPFDSRLCTEDLPQAFASMMISIDTAVRNRAIRSAPAGMLALFSRSGYWVAVPTGHSPGWQWLQAPGRCQPGTVPLVSRRIIAKSNHDRIDTGTNTAGDNQRNLPGHAACLPCQPNSDCRQRFRSSVSTSSSRTNSTSDACGYGDEQVDLPTDVGTSCSPGGLVP